MPAASAISRVDVVEDAGAIAWTSDPIAELVAFANREAHAALDAITVLPDHSALTRGWQP